LNVRRTVHISTAVAGANMIEADVESDPFSLGFGSNEVDSPADGLSQVAHCEHLR
jgi:hypothetical protein